MMLGFVILSHENPQQLARLVAALNRVYGNPPIACHHDTTQSPLDPGAFPANVAFVTPAIRTSWGKFSVVRATLAALEILYDRADPDWFVLLSAADYPVARAEEVHAALAASGADALLDYRPIGADAAAAARLFGPINPALTHFETSPNREMLRGRYTGAQLWLPMLRHDGPGGARLGRHTITLPFESPGHPFSEDYRCHYGDHWFSGSRKAAQALLVPNDRDLRLRRYLRWRASADECYYQSVLCNRPDLTLQRDNRRYAQWNGGGAHPAVLGAADLDAMLASGAHFARKFRHAHPVLDLIDERLLKSPSRTRVAPLRDPFRTDPTSGRVAGRRPVADDAPGN
ncbi:MAG: hypothetical protein KGM17_02640 [Sphingomonadales bacterium]|nr:hypothetical protein [Sphingomonadales bacterium]